jgi:cyclopropane-fatty-acyl-phospholipid synthase
MTPAQTIARRIVLALLRRMTAARLELVEPDSQVHVFGPGAPPSALIHVRDPRAWTQLLRGSRGLASSYVAGHWESTDPTAVVRVAARNAPPLDAMRRRLTLVREPYQRLRGAGASATRRRSREDIRRHYDLGNDLFALMLDDTMMYSAAYFETAETSLHDASIAKLELVCDKLDLRAGDHVIEIGAGWGGFAIHAAMTRGCRVTTTTISAEQHAYATERVARTGLRDRVTVLGSDYRDLTGEYTALVSLEMIEAVGWRHFGTFFTKCSDLLAPEGRMLLQAITIDDRAYAVEKASKSFIRTAIFPNGCLPSQQVIANRLARHTDLRMLHHEDLTDHYVTTLQRWRDNLETNGDRLTDLGYDERFQRLWHLYLSYSQAGFTERRIAVGQTLFGKPHWTGRVPSSAFAGPLAGPATHIARPAAERATSPGDLDAAISGWRP